MFKFLKIEKVKLFLRKIPKILGERAFLIFFLLFFLGLIFGGIIFYKYSFLPGKMEVEIIRRPIRFNKEIYLKILDEWQRREVKFERTKTRKYPNPFRAMNIDVKDRQESEFLYDFY